MLLQQKYRKQGIALKGLVHPKMKMMSLITHPHVIPNPKDLRSSSEHKLRYF